MTRIRLALDEPGGGLRPLPDRLVEPAIDDGPLGGANPRRTQAAAREQLRPAHRGTRPLRIRGPGNRRPQDRTTRQREDADAPQNMSCGHESRRARARKELPADGRLVSAARAIGGRARHRDTSPFLTSRSRQKGVTRSLVAANSAVGSDRGAGCRTAGARRGDRKRGTPGAAHDRVSGRPHRRIRGALSRARRRRAALLRGLRNRAVGRAAISRSRRSSSCTARATRTDRRARCGRGCSGSRSTCGDGIGARRWRGPGARATRRR